MELSKPTTKQDLRPPFQYIGDTGWDDWLRHLLIGYNIDSEIEFPAPTSENEIVRRETELGLSLPMGIKLFLKAFGPLHFEFLHILSPEEIDFFSNITINFDLTPDQEFQCETIVAVAETLIDEELTDTFGVDLVSGKIYLCSNYYSTFYEYLPSFDSLIKMAAIDLSWGFFGWDDDYIREMAEEIAKEELGLIEMEL